MCDCNDQDSIGSGIVCMVCEQPANDRYLPVAPLAVWVSTFSSSSHTRSKHPYFCCLLQVQVAVHVQQQPGSQGTLLSLKQYARNAV